MRNELDDAFLTALVLTAHRMKKIDALFFFQVYDQYAIHPCQIFSIILDFHISLLCNHLQTSTSSELV